jgi:hypothetical protein
MKVTPGLNPKEGVLDLLLRAKSPLEREWLARLRVVLAEGRQLHVSSGGTEGSEWGVDELMLVVEEACPP